MIENTAEDAYNATRAIYGKERLQSQTLHLRHFNNWIKSSLINKYCSPYSIVLDLASGKGGDISKWIHKAPAHIVFADIAKESMKECYKKYYKYSDSLLGTFIVGDTFGCKLNKLVPDMKFNIASCQFALHYAFESYEKASQAIENLCSQLLPGGYLLITTINAFRLVDLFREQEAKGGTQEQKRKISNSVFSAVRHFDFEPSIPAFGAGYVFYLNESVGHVKEYLIHSVVLDQLCAVQGMSPVASYGFHEFYNTVLNNPEFDAEKDLFYNTLKRQQGGLQLAEMTEDEWFVCGLYSFYVYQKQGTFVPPPKPDKKSYPKTWTMKLIDAKTGAEELVNVDHDDYDTPRGRTKKPRY
ncbi:mRNA capping enzyme, large subunit family protein [Trichomonas vaginalis G3]|uniref:mRNA cap guanine-N(7) methyltransferase n=1 Tax=Trichomonas vaginalis (strain ATCC PRA-98 / G3) TaxID=412133 RepID=A2FYD5_TRIV3|nr:mRNA (guanine-N7-)-methyltransferase protein [Trichomonas vaginalis G3]EAX90075.1 mRNA capping enzyme, large subunit family protein [Trichomonas vaginalis G3]KAI5485817.1 mRNA (guanine-N7-)-methyltransferase protein [Trichomonas vaginalis G3]|eukprot:XP_001303005.1 mRNA capping enzyme, large subunit family protein [Trichomonas vaginalis G3]